MTGELVSLCVAASWTAAAMLSEVVTRDVGVLRTNLWRMGATVVLLGALTVAGLCALPGEAAPLSWGGVLWLLLSGVVGYTLGDWCLYTGYARLGARTTQLFMPLAAPLSAVGALVLLGERLPLRACVAMAVTVAGIALALSGKQRQGTRNKEQGAFTHGGLGSVLWPLGAAAGQGLGLALSKVGMEAMPPPAGGGLWALLLTALFGAWVRSVAGLCGYAAIALFGGGRRSLAAGGWGLPRRLVRSLLAVTLTHVGTAQTLMALTPVLILLPTRALFHEPLNARQVAGAGISFAGAAIFFY